MGQGRSPWSSAREIIEWGPSNFSRTSLLAGFRENPAHSGEQPVVRGRLQVRFSPPRPRGVEPGLGTCREHHCGGGGGGIGVWRVSRVRLRRLSRLPPV